MLLVCVGTVLITSPVQANDSLNVELVGQIGGSTKAVFVRDNYAYIGEGTRLVILDVSNPAQPKLLSKSPVLSDLVRDIFVTADYAYVANGNGGLSIINVSNPYNLTTESNFATPDRALHVANGHVYLATDSNDLKIIDVTNSKLPKLVNTVTMPLLTRDVYI